MNKLLVICGPTAVGKTSLALWLARKFDAELISADSRQVYKKMDVGTGKDLPIGSKLKAQNPKLGGYYDIAEVRVWGYDLVDPRVEFSVAQYTKVATNIIKDIKKRNKLPILVGGTGLYIRAVVDGIDTIKIPRDDALRASLKRKSAEELFEQLAVVDPTKAASMNISDKKNPRRLVRAIEVAQYVLKSRLPPKKVSQSPFDSLFIGLTTKKDDLDKRIKKRVNKRLEKGFEKEVKHLLDSGVSWSDQSLQSLGYKQWKEFLEGKDRGQMIELWKREEYQYAKRQLNWFKKDKRINWFDISRGKWQKNIEKLVKKWYSTKDVAAN